MVPRPGQSETNDQPKVKAWLVAAPGLGGAVGEEMLSFPDALGGSCQAKLLAKNEANTEVNHDQG